MHCDLSESSEHARAAPGCAGAAARQWPIRVVAFDTAQLPAPPSILLNAPDVDKPLSSPSLVTSSPASQPCCLLYTRVMATPSSSTTSPSPPIAYLASQPLHPSASASTDPSERENRKKAVQKFLARAEISMVCVSSLSTRQADGCCACVCVATRAPPATKGTYLPPRPVS